MPHPMRAGAAQLRGQGWIVRFNHVGRLCKEMAHDAP